MLFALRNAGYLRSCILRLTKEVRISCVCTQNIRLKSDDITTVLNKNVSTVQKTIDLTNVKDDEEKKTRPKFCEQMVSKSPHALQPYLKIMRIHRPIGSWLLFWPCSWSISLAAAPGCFPDPYLLMLFGAGSLVMRGAGCTINDMWDRDIDRKVARTLDRPLVNGEMTMEQAFAFLAAQLSVGLLILLQLNWYSVFLGASSLGLVITYPLMKRITYWPQMMLGMTFNWGILLGYSAVCGYVDWEICLPLYTAAVCWTVIYDTIYAHQDISDDILLGIKSTAIKFKENTKYWLTGFTSLMISSLLTTGIMAEQTLPYYASVSVVASHLAWQIYSLNIKNPKDCGYKFISNYYVGAILFCGIILGNIFKEKKQNNSQKSLVDH